MDYKEVKNLIWVQRQGGLPKEQAKLVIDSVVRNDGKMNVDMAARMVDEIYLAGTRKPMPDRIDDILAVTSGYFSVTDCYKELQAVTEQDKGAIRVDLYRRYKRGDLERHKTKSGWYRLPNKESLTVDWKKADPKNTLDMALPFGLHKHIKIFPKNIGVGAGTKSAGKTAFVNDFIKLNQNNPNLPQPIWLWTSEGSPEEIRSRFDLHEDMAIDDWNFQCEFRTLNFADVIKPDHINVVDYLRVAEGEFFKVGDEISLIADKLNRGFCLVMIQKDIHKELGVGAGRTLDAARFYFTLNKAYPNNVLNVIDVKNWRNSCVASDGQTVQLHNPNGLKIHYKLVAGTKFIKVKEDWLNDLEVEPE
jgi:hypothetical protein